MFPPNYNELVYFINNLAGDIFSIKGNKMIWSFKYLTQYKFYNLTSRTLKPSLSMAVHIKQWSQIIVGKLLMTMSQF